MENHFFSESCYSYKNPQSGTWRIRIERDYTQKGLVFYDKLPEEYAFMVPIIHKINEIVMGKRRYYDYIRHMSCLCCWIPWHLNKSSLERKYKQADDYLEEINKQMNKNRWTSLIHTSGLYLEYEYT